MEWWNVDIGSDSTSTGSAMHHTRTTPKRHSTTWTGSGIYTSFTSPMRTECKHLLNKIVCMHTFCGKTSEVNFKTHSETVNKSTHLAKINSGRNVIKKMKCSLVCLFAIKHSQIHATENLPFNNFQKIVKNLHSRSVATGSIRVHRIE